MKKYENYENLSRASVPFLNYAIILYVVSSIHRQCEIIIIIITMNDEGRWMDG